VQFANAYPIYDARTSVPSNTTIFLTTGSLRIRSRAFDHGNEIEHGQNIPMGFRKCLPGRLTFSFRRWFKAVCSEAVANR